MDSVLNSSFNNSLTIEGMASVPTPIIALQDPDEYNLTMTKIDVDEVRMCLKRLTPINPLARIDYQREY